MIIIIISDCEISKVGKAVYHRHTKSDYGSWMRDPEPRNSLQEASYWVTDPNAPYNLYEFPDKSTFRKNKIGKNYTLPQPFMVRVFFLNQYLHVWPLAT